MSSLTPAQGPTSTWRSSMSVCPTVSMTPLSLIETAPPNFPIHSSYPLLCTLSLFLSPVSHHIPSYFFLVQTVCSLHVQHLCPAPIFHLCHTMNFSLNITCKTFWFSSALPLLLMCFMRRVSSGSTSLLTR